MAKWINTATGLEVPASEVRETIPGSGIFVHETVVTAARIIARPTTRDRRTPPPDDSGELGDTTYSVTEPGPVRVIDGFAIKIGTNDTFNPDTDTLQAQALASQAALRARGGV